MKEEAGGVPDNQNGKSAGMDDIAETEHQPDLEIVSCETGADEVRASQSSDL